MSLLPDDCFFIIIDDKFRVGKLKRNTNKGCILKVYQNDDKAWDDLELESSRFIPLEDYPSCFFQDRQEYPVSILGIFESGSALAH